MTKVDFGQECEDEIPERDRKAHVDPYEKSAEVGDISPNSRVLIKRWPHVSLTETLAP